MFLTITASFSQMERKAYEVVVEEGKFLYKQTGEFLNTVGESKWIFVLSTSKNLYVGKKNKGTFQHSSFLAGGATSAAGRLIVENGNLKVYRYPKFLNFYFVFFGLFIGVSGLLTKAVHLHFNRQFGLTAATIGQQKKIFRSSFCSSRRTMLILLMSG